MPVRKAVYRQLAIVLAPLLANTLEVSVDKGMKKTIRKVADLS